MPSESGFAELNGTQLYYEVAGSGPSLVLLHAGIADSRMWDQQFAELAGDFRVVRFDMRGFGRSPMTAGSYAHHHDLAALLRHLGISRTALLGCSLGGRVCIDFTLEYPGVTTALVAVASALGGFSSAYRPPQWEALEAAEERGDLASVCEYEVEIWVDGPHRRPDEVPADIRERVYEMNLIALATPEDLGDEQELDPPALERLHEIAVPALVVIGELDQPSILERCAAIERGIPGAESVRLPTAHLPNMERPAEFNRIVRAFLQRS